MDIVEKNLAIIANCINSCQYKEVETERFELKDLSAGWGKDWYKSVCSFLNTNGGVIVIGIRDNNNINPKNYKFNGYTNSEKNENHLKQELPKFFTDIEGKELDLSSQIYRF